MVVGGSVFDSDCGDNNKRCSGGGEMVVVWWWFLCVNRVNIVESVLIIGHKVNA